MRTRLFFIFFLLTPAVGFTDTLETIDTAKMKTTWDKKAFRALSPTLDDTSFDLKWKGAMKTPLALMRAFERQFYLDLLPFSNLGPVGLCHGDAHFDNFGFLRTANHKTVFAINDLDDSGYCPVAVDILRFLVSVRLSEHDEKLAPDLAAVYSLFIEERLSREAFGKLPPQFFPPSFAEESAKSLREDTREDKFVFGERLSELKGVTVAEVRTALQKGNPNLEVFDAAEYSKPTGGSAGLKRYWVLVGREKYREILELKLSIEPAVAVKNWGVDLPELKPRIELVAAVFFKNLDIPFYQTITLQKQEFLLRSRAKTSFEWDAENVTGEDRALVYAHEVSILARLHKPRWKDREQIAGLRDWLTVSSEAVAQRIRDIYEALKADAAKSSIK